MAIDYIRKKGSNAQPFLYSATAYSDGTPTNFAGASVQFVGVKYGDVAPKISGAGTIATTTFSYAPLSTDVDTVGYYHCEWIVTYGNGKTERWPCADIETGVPMYLTLVIVPSLS